MGLPAACIDGPIEIEKNPSWIIEVDYDRSLADMIEAAGYDSVHQRITHDAFPLEGQGIRRFAFCYFWFGGNNSPAEARETHPEDLGPWSPGKLEHKLAVMARFPNHLERFPIAAFGSLALIDDMHDIPTSRMDHGRRSLDLTWERHRPQISNRRLQLDVMRYLCVRQLS